MLSRWRKEYREGIIVADKRKKIIGQSLTKKALKKEQKLEREKKQLKGGLYVLKKWQRFLATGENLRPDGNVPKVVNKVWVADVTYLKVKGVWRYLSVIMDLYSRRIISWSLDKNRTMEVTKRTLQNAIKKRKPAKDLMIHTDRGVEYRGQVSQEALKRNGIIHSLSLAGKCTDNAHMESFFIQ